MEVSNYMLVTLSNRGLEEFPELTKRQLNATNLNLSGNKLTNLRGMVEMPNLKELNLDYNKIKSLKYAYDSENLVSISLKNNPISNESHLKVMCLIVFGQKLEQVNQQEITAAEYRLADFFRPKLHDYIIDGYVISSLDPIRLLDPVTRKRKNIYLDSPLKNAVSQYRMDQSILTPEKPKVATPPQPYSARAPRKQTIS